MNTLCSLFESRVLRGVSRSSCLTASIEFFSRCIILFDNNSQQLSRDCRARGDLISRIDWILGFIAAEECTMQHVNPLIRNRSEDRE